MLLSKVIAAEGEHKASRALRHAAEVIADSPAALQVDLDKQTQTDRCTAELRNVTDMADISV